MEDSTEYKRLVEIGDNSIYPIRNNTPSTNNNLDKCIYKRRHDRVNDFKFKFLCKLIYGNSCMDNILLTIQTQK